MYCCVRKLAPPAKRFPTSNPTITNIFIYIKTKHIKAGEMFTNKLGMEIEKGPYSP